jgi:hypothetical protein
MILDIEAEGSSTVHQKNEET